MKQISSQKQDSEFLTDLDPNVRQQQAADPDCSVWVSASAGTGKTKVLTDRVLRLLLPRQNGMSGTNPHKILCLTFTKAAASEMAIRINKTLGMWAVISNEELEKELKDLLGKVPSINDIETARRLFADVVDTPGGLKIMTIHSFCQSVLSRFPLESGLPPYFSVLEDMEASTLLASARDQVLESVEKESGSIANQALHQIAKTVNSEQFNGLIKSVTSERNQLNRLIDKTFDIEGLYVSICETLNIEVGINAKDVLLEACQNEAFNHADLKSACTSLIDLGSKTYQVNGEIINNWLIATPEERTENFQAYLSIFLKKQDGEPKDKLGSKDVPEFAVEILRQEQIRLIELKDKINAAHCAIFTRDILHLSQAIINKYQALKINRATLDFDDLILKTKQLLNTKNFASWVLYKLDQGIDHILVDEAQDTNPEQWEIIEALCNEFFAGKGQTEKTRSIFTVGDEKQSIYSFQRASPKEFKRMRHFFADKIITADAFWKDLSLNISFRSTQAILKTVDAVFSLPALQKNLSDEQIKHHAFRHRQAGHVELWPVFEPKEKKEIDPWESPTKIIESPSGQTMLAEYIAKTIKNWIDNKKILSSKNRPIHAGDILILVRTRTTLVNQITRALKNNNIPVSGVDRMVLGNQLVVQDLTAFAEFTLLPDDDLTLACILKSPVIGLNEEDIYNLAIDRSSTLWKALQNSPHNKITNYLSSLIHMASDMPPYEFFSHILQLSCPADKISATRAIRGRLGDDALDPIDEFLNATLAFERTYPSSLQKFLHWHYNNQTEVKRELSEHSKHVRIMTIHGAKGLQAFRTFTSPPSQNNRRFIWPDKSGLNIPLWSPRKDFDCEVFKQALGKLDKLQEEEYQRLLYVAMTRAEDQLYVAGYKEQKTPINDSWYNYIKAGLETLPEHELLGDGRICVSNPQTGDPERNKIVKASGYQSEKLPLWANIAAPKEPLPPKPLIPSKPSEIKTNNFTRGNLTHKLLEILPEIPVENRKNTATIFIKRYGNALSANIQNGIINETLKILEHPEFAPIFGVNSQAEVPITAIISKQIISGQIDRLLITDKEIWIIDYKTNRSPPEKPEHVEDIYIKQLKAYVDVLQQIYPHRIIHSALLWTDSLILMPIDV